MEKDYDLSRFYEPQQRDYAQALAEIRRGAKVSHWIWYIFPQLKGLGRSYFSEFYGLEGLEEAWLYLQDPVLGARLREITAALLALDSRDPQAVIGSRTDSRKLCSSMTLFALAAPQEELFYEVLRQFFQGDLDRRTLAQLGL